MNENIPQMSDAASVVFVLTRCPAWFGASRSPPSDTEAHLPRGARRTRDLDAVNKQIPPGATAPEEIKQVEVAGIKPGGCCRVVLARGADLEER